MTSRPTKKKSTRPSKARAERDDDSPRSTYDSLHAYIRGLARFEPLSSEEERELGRRIQMGDGAALNRLVEANLRFVVSYAKRYRGIRLSFLDLIHEGNLGLIEAGRRFDPNRGVRFISYAVWWIRQAILHALSTQGTFLRVPVKHSAQAAKLKDARDHLTAELERAPTTAELSAETDLSENEIAHLQHAADPGVSLSASLGEDGGTELADTLVHDGVSAIEVELVRSSLVKLTREMLVALDKKEQQVISMRFGLDGEEPMTLQDIGERLGVSRERVRQIESKAKEKLRCSRQAQSLRGYLN